jgi:hypothetical protein
VNTSYLATSFGYKVPFAIDSSSGQLRQTSEVEIGHPYQRQGPPCRGIRICDKIADYVRLSANSELSASMETDRDARNFTRP